MNNTFKNKIKHISIFILVLAITSGGMVYIFRAQLISYFIPKLEQIGDVHIRVKNDTSYISAKLVIQNQSFLKIEIDTIKYKVSLFEKTYLQNEQSLGAVLPAHGSDTVDLSLKIPFVAILKDLKAEREKEDSANYSINVSLQYATVFGKSEIPINKSAKIKIPRPPDLKIVDMKWKKVHLKSLSAIAKIKIINYNTVTLSIKELSYSMNILKHGTIKGSYEEAITIKPQATTFIELPLEINVKHIGKTVFQILINKDNYDYILALNATMESLGPVKQSFQVDLVKEGKIELKK